ncbi:MAG: molybdopterin cofactor-binding domain-containing protein [Longimicrobiales bacterium]
MTTIAKLDRRDFLKLGAVAGGGLFLGVYVPDARASAQGKAATFAPNAFVRIDPDDTVTIWVAKAEMGQGVRTSLPMIVADEMDADWSRIRILQADAHPDRYGRMTTVGSSSVRNGAWTPLREAGAAAREMLLAAAAARWGVGAMDLRTENGRVLHDGTGRSATYGELSEAAAALPVPAQPQLKSPGAFRLIGKRIPLVDTHAKVTGQAGFGTDVRVPGMLYATAVHPPVFGDTVASFDATRARAVPGVRDVFQLTQGVAVTATNTWAAFQGAKALDITYARGGFAMNSDEIFRHFREVAEQHGSEAAAEGDVAGALGTAVHRITATYEAPYLAHATMEPMNCTADVRADRCEIWAPTQSPQGTQSAAAELTGLPIEAVTVHVQYLGCGWGRRSRTDFVQDAVETSKQAGAPVQLLWSREEDMQHDFYRPAAHVRMEGGVDGAGRVQALNIHVVAPPFGGGRGGVDRNAVAGLVNQPYDITNLRVTYVRPDVAVPVSYWRSVGPSQNCFFLESFIDELAHAAGQDPVEFRRVMLDGTPRLRHVLEVASERAGWGSPPPAGRGRGVALVIDKGGIVAQVAEVSLGAGRVRVHKVTCAMDCGRVIHPGIVEAQVVGSIVGGLSAVLYGEITIETGRVKQSNFHDYPMLRIDEMPEVEVVLVESEEEPGGAGEPALPPTAPAIANALFALTGTRVRRLPIRSASLSNDGG